MVKNKIIPTVDYNICMACCVCISDCPFSCLAATKNGMDAYRKAYPELINKETCTGCRICEKACPVEAISMSPR